MHWKKNTPDSPPPADGRYAIIYQHGPIVRRFIADYSVREGWLTGMPDIKILCWAPLPGIPQWVIEAYSIAEAL